MNADMSIFTKSEPEVIEPGKFIVLEGTDGTGKTTQIELLAKTLGSYDYDGLIFDFPQYSTMSSEMLKKYLAGEYGKLNSEAASILYALDRFDASFKIRKHLEEGKIILANRYSTSNAAHQGAKISDRDERVKFYKWLDHLEYTTFNIPKPDLTIILHAPVGYTMEQIAKGHEAKGTKPDLHDKDMGHLIAAERAYLEIAGLFPNTKLVECVENDKMLSAQEIHSKVWELVRRIVLKNNSF